MQQFDELRELRLKLVTNMFSSYIAGEASLEQVLQEQAKRFDGLDIRLNRVEKLLRLALDDLSSPGYPKT